MKINPHTTNPEQKKVLDFPLFKGVSSTLSFFNC